MDQGNKAIRTSTDSNRVMIVWLDVRGKPVNTFTPEVLSELAGVLAMIDRDQPAGVIFTSAKADHFCAGADLFAIGKLDHDAGARFVADGQMIFDHIAHLHMPTVAAMNGDALGGGFELALACKFRVASDNAKISLGLPEVKIGLIPAWGGTTRMSRLIGLTRALPLLLAGKTLSPRKAKKLGLVDDVVRPEALRAAALRWAQKGSTSSRRGSMLDRISKLSPIRRRILDTAQKRMMEQSHGHYPAPGELIDVLRQTFSGPVSAGLAAERAAIDRLMQSAEFCELLRLFFLRQSAKKSAIANISAKPAEVKYAAVIGGGTMGSGIVHALIRAGIQVRLIEVNDQAASAGLSRIKKMLDEDTAAGRLSPLDARRAMNRVSPATEYSGLKLADLVIEAVVEQMAVKKAVFQKLGLLARPNAILASNTSALSLTEIAADIVNPGRVIGMHFFNPVPKMPLLEIVRTERTDDATLATVVALSSRIGKTPVVANDAPGFIVNRVLVPYLSEALVVATEGTPITEIDRAMKDWGMPMGPFELLDEIGLDVSLHVLSETSAQLGGRFPVPPGLEQAISHGWLGKKSGRGFYISPTKHGETPTPNAPLLELLGKSTVRLDEDTIQWRLMLPMVNEAVRLLDEGVVDSPATIDLATVLGLGLAPFRGGLMKFADSVGAAELVLQMDELAAQVGPRFAPADLLRQWASEHQGVEEFRSPMPFIRLNRAPAFRTSSAVELPPHV